MTPDELKVIEARAKAATPGPWELATSNSWRRFLGASGVSVCEPVVHRIDGHPDLSMRNEADGDFIAAARTDVPRLCAALREAWRERDIVRAAYEAEHERYLGVVRESGAETERLRAALREIAIGKTQADNEHPLGEHLGMAGRFVAIAQRALEGK